MTSHSEDTQFYRLCDHQFTGGPCGFHTWSLDAWERHVAWHKAEGHYELSASDEPAEGDSI